MARNMKYPIVEILKIFWVLITVFNMAIIGVATFLFIEYRPLVIRFLNGHYKINLETDIAVNTRVPLSASIDTQISIPVDYSIPLSLPLKTVVSIPFDQTVALELDDAVPVRLTHTLNIDKGIKLQGILPVETVVKTKLFGVNTDLPIDVDIPIDMVMPIKEDLKIDEVIPLRLAKPIPVKLKEEVEIPIDHLFEAVLPLKGEISLPLKVDASTELNIDRSVPVILGLDMSFEEKEAD